MYTKAAIGCFLFLTTISYVVADVSHLSGGNVSPAFKHSSGGDIPVVDDLSARSFNQQNGNIRNNIPGEPNVDYPIYSLPPISSFSCKGRHYGYYADVESRCQVFRVCATTDLTGKGFAFLCPNGTLFNQKFFVCDWYKNVDCFASESFFSRNEFFGTKMGLMTENDMMSMVQGMVDYTKQPQFNNQNVNNNGGFPFTNSQLPKQLDNTQSLINQNNGLASFGSGNLNNQQFAGGSNRGPSNNNAQVPQRGSDILSQPIFPSENSRFTTPSQTPSSSGNAVPNAVPADSVRFGQNGNFNSINSGPAFPDSNSQQPTVFVSSLGEISTDPNLRFNPFTTAIVSTKTFDALSSNVDPVSTYADQVQKFVLHGQFNQLNDNTQSKTQLHGGLDNLQQEINHLSVSTSNESNLNQQRGAPGSDSLNKLDGTNGPKIASNDQSSQTLTAVYSGSGDLLSHTISQYGKADSSQVSAQNGRDPTLSALVNSLGETVFAPVFSGEGNLLSQTISQIGTSTHQNDSKQQSKPDTFTAVAQQGIPLSTPKPRLQTPFSNEQSRITNTPFSTGSTGSTFGPNTENVPKASVVYSGEGNLLSQTIGQKEFIRQPQQSFKSESSQSIDNSGKSRSPSQSIQQTVNSESVPTQHNQKQTISFTATNGLSNQRKSVTNQGTSIGSSSSITQTTQAIPGPQLFGQKAIAHSNQQPPSSNAQSNTANQFGSYSQPTTYSQQVSFGHKVASNSAATSTTTIPYSPSVPPFRSTTANTYTPTAISYNQHTQAYNGQSLESRSFTQHHNGQSTFSSNQFQVPSKEYLPSPDNTRTARTNEQSFGNHGSLTSKLSSSQNFARNGFNQRDGRQQFTYPVDQTDSKTLDNTNDLPNLGADADPTKQNLTNRDVTHIDKYLYQNQIEQPKNETDAESTVTTSERYSDIQLSSISINDIFDLNRILQDGGRSEDTASEEIELSPVEEDVTTEQTSSELVDFKRSPIIVAPIVSDGPSNDIEDNEILEKFNRSTNLLFAGLQLSLYEEQESSNDEIKNELNDEIFRNQDIYETKIRNPKDVYSSGGGLKQSNSIKLIFERAKNRSNDFRVKLKSRKEQENKAKRTFALPPKTAEEKLVTILKPLLRNITVSPNRYMENNTKIAGFINNDLKSSIGEPRQRHSLAPRILFKDVKTIEDIERIATGIDTVGTDNDELTSETKLSNRIALPDDSLKLPTSTDTDHSTIHSKSNEPSLEVVDKDKDWSYYTKTMLFPQRNQPKPIRDHETASSNQQNYAYSTSQSQQSNQQTYPLYSQYNSYPQYQQQQQQPIHYATIDNRPNPSQSFQAPPLQSNYPISIQNNPQSHSSYHTVTNRYIPSAPLPIPSSIPPSLPSIVHPTSQYSTQQKHSFATNQSPRTTSNEKVVVKVIPATGWYLNDANERQSFLDAVSRGLLSEKGFVYVNDVQSGQRQQSNFNSPQPQGRSQIDIDEEAYFRGSSSYESPLNSVGKLSGDSDSVSAYLDSTTAVPSPSGYRYEHPRRSFNV